MLKYNLYRCKFIKIKGNYILGKDIFSDKLYYIKKNRYSRNFKIGTDNYFYATEQINGIIFKKVILSAVDYNIVVNKNSI